MRGSPPALKASEVAVPDGPGAGYGLDVPARGISKGILELMGVDSEVAEVGLTRGI